MTNLFSCAWASRRLGAAMRQQFTMGEFGVERFLVPDAGNANPNFFRLELPVASAANIQVATYDEHDPFQSRGASASIDKRSLPPVAELHGLGSSGAKLVTVTMEAGKPFILQYFNASYVNHFSVSGDYWLSSIHAGYAEDSIGATAVLTRQRRNGMYGLYGSEEYLDARVLELANTPWHRRFNLLDELTLFVNLPGTTKIKAIDQGVKARYRFEPFLTSRPKDYKTPPWQESGHVFDLDRGLYVLTVQPETKGILDLQLLPPGSVMQDVMSFLSKARAEAKAMLALSDVMKRRDAKAEVQKLNVAIGSQSQTLEIGPANKIVQTSTNSPAKIVLRSEARLPLIVRAETSYLPQALGSEAPSGASGFVVTRELLRQRGRNEPADKMVLSKPGTAIHLTVGDVVEEHVEVTSNANHHYVAIAVPLAAGLEPLNPKLATAPAEATPSGNITATPSYVAYMDDQVTFYYDALPKGTFHFYFRTRATVPGQFTQPQARAELMYDGAVHGESVGARVDVSAKE